MLPLIAMLLAADGPANCPADVPPPPSAFRAWATPGNRPAIGVRFDLAGSTSVAGETAAERGRGGKAAFITLTVPRAGRYGVALSEKAWVDMARGQHVLAATGHEHGPACGGIAKIVWFDLAPGDYQLRLSGIKAPSVGVLVAAQ